MGELAGSIATYPFKPGRALDQADEVDLFWRAS